MARDVGVSPAALSRHVEGNEALFHAWHRRGDLDTPTLDDGAASASIVDAFVLGLVAP